MFVDPETLGSPGGAELVVRDARIAELERLVAELRELLNRRSHNSHLPPSTDPPGGKPDKRGRKGKSSSGRKRGGKQGHPGHRRGLLSEDRVDHVVNLYPSHCEHCTTPLPQTPDRAATRTQQTELPPIKPTTTEYRRHAVACPCCKRGTRAPSDER